MHPDLPCQRTSFKGAPGSEEIVVSLQNFSAGPLAVTLKDAPFAPDRPIMLKHALAILLLPECCRVFNVRLVCVLRPVAEIEVNCQRRRWGPVYGALCARVLYGVLFDFIVNSNVFYCMVRYRQLLKRPAEVYRAMMPFLNLTERLQVAVGHVSRDAGGSLAG